MIRLAVAAGLLWAVLASGCQKSMRNDEGSVVLRMERTTENVQDSGFISLILSNGTDRSVSFFEIRPNRLICAIQMTQEGKWITVNQESYCTTGWDAVVVQAGESYVMTIPEIHFRTPWRVGMHYWEVPSDGIVDFSSPVEIWTAPQVPTK